MTVFEFSSPLRHDDATVTADLRDATAFLRPLGPGEDEPLDRVFSGMSPHSRASRYLTGLAGMPESMRRALTAVDGHHHVAWLATVGDEPVGIGRYLRTGPCAAEIAFEVVDAHHGRGLGTLLVDVLTTVAAVSGIHRLEATVLPSNRASLRLLERVGLSFRSSLGTLEGEGPLRLLDPPRVDRPAVVRLAMAAAESGPFGGWSERVAGGQ
jgi:RimJ/RimL family protein N-acetyltransferase